MVDDIENLKFEEIVELKGDVVVGHNEEKGDIYIARQMKMILDKINEATEALNKFSCFLSSGIQKADMSNKSIPLCCGVFIDIKDIDVLREWAKKFQAIEVVEIRVCIDAITKDFTYEDFMKRLGFEND